MRKNYLERHLEISIERDEKKLSSAMRLGGAHDEKKRQAFLLLSGEQRGFEIQLRIFRECEKNNSFDI